MATTPSVSVSPVVSSLTVTPGSLPNQWQVSGTIEVTIPPPVDGGGTGTVVDDWPMTADGISARLGKKWESGPETRKTNPMSVTMQAPAGSDPRIANFEFGKILTRWNNFWSTTGNGLIARGNTTIPFRVQDFAAYAGAAATAARPDLTGFIPDPDLPWAPVDGIATCTHRSQSCVSNEALVGTKSGNITSLGTQTSRDPGTWRPVINVPDMTITAICSTSMNEIAIAVGFSPTTKKGKIAYIGVEAKYLGSHTMQRMCMPNEGSFSWFKLLGVQDLPFDWPSDVTAASNGNWSGPSQTNNQDLGQIDLTNPFTRAGMLDEGENNNTPWGWVFSTKAIVAVLSKKAGKVAIINLSKYIEMIRQDYLVADQDKYLAIQVAESKGDYPPTFAEVPDNIPTIDKVYDIPTAQTVIAVPKMERWSNDYWKVMVAGEDGNLTTIDVSPLLARYSWQSVGPGGIICQKNLGGNVTHLTWGRYDNDWLSKPNMPNNGSDFGYCNTLVATVRDLQMFRYVWSYRELCGLSGRDLSTINGKDPIASYVNARTSEVVGLFSDGIITFTIGGVSVPVVDGYGDQSWYYAVAGNNEAWNENPKLVFPDGDFLFSYTDENVN